VAELIGTLPQRNYAVMVDEAHSSQSGEAAHGLRRVLAAPNSKKTADNEVRDSEAHYTSLQEEDAQDPDEPTYEDEIARVMGSRGKQPNLSFLAFTATPKVKTLEVFGRPGPEGKPGKLQAFVRLYSFVSEVMPWTDRELEVRYSFGRFLLKRLPRHPRDQVDLEGEVDLHSYRLARTKGEQGEVVGPTAVGTRQQKDKVAPLKEIIELINEPSPPTSRRRTSSSSNRWTRTRRPTSRCKLGRRRTPSTTSPSASRTRSRAS
jgi:hypothetical protein